MASIQGLSKRALLVILDGYGLNESDNKNAIKHANTPNLDNLFMNYPFTKIEAGGVSVGLPKGVIGNSEVGHMNLGAGKPVRQDLVRINEAIDKGSFSELEKLKELIKTAKNNMNRVHLLGLFSDGGVHSHINHLEEIIKVLNTQDIDTFFHAFMDGRDTARDVGGKYIERLSKAEGVTFASMQGRSIGMDRDRRWEKIKHSYDMMLGKGKITDVSPSDYLKSEYANEIYDEFVTPTLFNEDYAIKEGDCIFFINFRPDRAIQLALAFNDPSFNEFERPFIPPYYLCMTPYVPEEVELPILFDKEKVTGGISEHLSNKGHKQIKIAETEKYAHVTYFFNGGEKKPFKNEEHFLIPSPKDCNTYDEKPQMSALEVTEKLSELLSDDSISFYTVNYANSDMVGHTGNYDAAVKAVETLDDCMGKIIAECEKNNVTLLLTADHGNSDQMVYEDGTPHTSHTNSLVPFCVFHPSLKETKIDINGSDHALKDVAPTVLYAMGEEIPSNYTGINIFN